MQNVYEVHYDILLGDRWCHGPNGSLPISWGRRHVLTSAEADARIACEKLERWALSSAFPALNGDQRPSKIRIVKVELIAYDVLMD